MAVSLRDRNRTVSRDPRQREGIAAAFSKHREGRVAKAVRLKALPASLYRVAVPPKVLQRRV